MFEIVAHDTFERKHSKIVVSFFLSFFFFVVIFNWKRIRFDLFLLPFLV